MLARGLPKLPSRLRQGDPLPIARWTGPEFGAVLLITDCEHDPYCPPEEPYIVMGRDCRRTVTGGEGARVSSGTDWEGGVLPLLDVLSGQSQLDSEVAYSTGPAARPHTEGPAWQSHRIVGEVGPDAVWVEVEQVGLTVRHPVEAPAGLIVVAIDATAPADVRVLDERGDPLTDLHVEAH